MIVMTIISSINVKPEPRRSLRRFRNHDPPIRFCDSVFNSNLRPTNYQSEYLVPSSAVPVDFEYTSNTFLPPQLVESASSRTARKPHSACPVIGSTGILRRK